MIISVSTFKGSDKRATHFFKWKELECRCHWLDCVNTVMTQRTLDSLESTRKEYGSGIKVTSGYRCNRNNEIVGGVVTSNHKWGDAADLIPHDNNLKRLETVARKHFKFIKVYENFIHCDNRANREF